LVAPRFPPPSHTQYNSSNLLSSRQEVAEVVVAHQAEEVAVEVVVEEADHPQADHQVAEHQAEVEAVLPEDLPLQPQPHLLQPLHQHRTEEAYMEAHHRCSTAPETRATSSYRNFPCTT
jgi:hypothetical protein